jgi:nitrile hydratase
VADSFRPGDRVVTTHVDPPHHTRLPGYARGATGTVVDKQGYHRLPDAAVQGANAEPEPVYTVAFTARELFGNGDHDVRLALWESYLRPERDR